MPKRTKPAVLSLRLDPELVKRLDRARAAHLKLFTDNYPEIAFQHEYSRATVLREAIRVGLDVIERKTKELAEEEAKKRDRR